MKKKLNLGVGINYFPDFYNVDKLKNVKADLYHDLESYPWPLPDNQFEEVRISHLVEHIGRMGDENSWFDFWREVWRVCKNGAVIDCIAPYFQDHNAVGDPGHRKLISESSFYFLSKETYKWNKEHKTAMTQYEIDFDFEIRAQKIFGGNIETHLKVIK